MKAILAGLAALAASVAFAQAVPNQGAARHQAPKAATLDSQQKPWGRAGNAKAPVSRTIEISMTDDMRFTPARLEVREGETIRFRVRNAGKLEHEMILGTRAELEGHLARMLKKAPAAPGHEETGVEVKPGRTGDLVWNFNRPGEFHFACLVPGHYQAGMVGSIQVTRKP